MSHLRNVTGNSLFKLFQELFFEKDFPGTRPPAWNLKDVSLLSKLIAEQGEDKARDYLMWVFENWSMLKKKFRINGHPTCGVLWGFRMSFFPVMNEPRQNSVEYKKGAYATNDTGKMFLRR
jgi:hypothetical protein